MMMSTKLAISSQETHLGEPDKDVRLVLSISKSS